MGTMEKEQIGRHRKMLKAFRFSQDAPNFTPFSMRIAAITEALDNIKVDVENISMFDRTNGINIRTIYFFGWKKRLVKKASERLTNDINEAIKDGKNYLRPYCIAGFIKRKFIYISIEMNYEFRKHYRLEKIEKITNKIYE